MLTSLPVTLYPSKLKSAWLLLLMLALATLGGMLVWLELDVLWGWITIGFFGFGAVVMALQFHPRASYLLLDQQGFALCSLFRAHHYEWRYVERFGTYQLSLNNFVGWNFTPDYPQRSRGHALTKGLCGFEAGLPETYGLKAQELCELLNHLRTLLLDSRDADAD